MEMVIDSFAYNMAEWLHLNTRLAARKVALLGAKRELKGAEADVYQEKTPKELGANEAARKASLFIITYPYIEAVDLIQADIYRLEVQVDYFKALVNYETGRRQ